MDKMREEFEVWCCERGFTLKTAETNCGVLIDGEYGHPRVQLAWESWKASRASLRVELPTKINDRNDSFSCGFDSAISSAEVSLEYSGVSYK